MEFRSYGPQTDEKSRMTLSTNSDWLDLCREYRIDPDEVRIVFSRYDAYRKFMANGRDPDIALDQWFRFYHMEKASEAGGETDPAPSGCSVDSGAEISLRDCVNRISYIALVRLCSLRSNQSFLGQGLTTRSRGAAAIFRVPLSA